MRILRAGAISVLGFAALLAAADATGGIRSRAGSGADIPGLANTRRLERTFPTGDDPGGLRQLVALRPRASNAWIRLGLLEERDGRFREAEEALLAASRVDRQLAPAWALANYYFRRGERDAFWLWARRAAERTYDDYRPLLRLASAWEPSAERVVERLGGGKHLIRTYLNVLIGEGRLPDADRVAAVLLAYGDPDDRRRVADLIDRHTRAGEPIPPSLEVLP